MTKPNELNDRIYEAITDDSGEERSCENIPDEACDVVPGSYLRNTISGVFSKLAEQLASPGLILPWLLSATGASSFFAGALVPIKDAGSLLPQLAVSAKIRARSVRKTIWTLSAVIQGISLLLMGVAVYLTEGNTLGWIVLGTLTAFSLASGVASVAFKDVLGKTIPKGKRGQLLALRSTLGGILTTAGGFVLYRYVEGTNNTITYVVLIGSAAVLWFASALTFYSISEKPGATEGGRSPIKELKQGMALLKHSPNLQRFILARALLMAIPFSQPFLVLFGKDIVGSGLDNLGVMVIAAGIAGIVSSPFWGRFADYSSRKLMIVIGLFGSVLLAAAIAFPKLPETIQTTYLFAGIIVLQVMAHGGARLSRKTYLVDMAPAKERPLYVALSNTLIGVSTIFFVVLGLIADVFSVTIMLWTLSILSLFSAVVSLGLKEV